MSLSCWTSLYLASLSLAAPLWSQVSPVRTPSDMVTAFAVERSRTSTGRQASTEIVQALTHPGSRPAADVAAILDGLERLAVGSKTPTVRREAAFLLSIPGSRRSTSPSAATFERLQRVYAKSSDPTVKAVVVDVMGDLNDHRKAAAFLKGVALQDSTGVFAGPALSSLLTMGADGRVALGQLHDSDAVPNSESRQILATMAKNGYKLPEQ
jgi:hypothetical protein